MSTFKDYISGYAFGVKSLLVGMRTSMKVFMQKKVTERYPENRHTTLYIPERHRAMLVMPKDENGENRCVACGLCQMACPNGTINITSETRETEDGKKKKVLLKYEYDLGACMVLPTVCERMSARRDPFQQSFRKRRVRERKAGDDFE